MPPGTKPIHKQFAKNFSCIRAGANTWGGMYSHRHEFPQGFWKKYSEDNSSKIFSCIRANANTGPACICTRIDSTRIASCMYCFGAGGYGKEFHGNGPGEARVNFLALPASNPYFHAWCPQIVPNCSCECSFEPCHSKSLEIDSRVLIRSWC